MSTELLNRAASLRTFAGPGRNPRVGNSHLEATIDCAERLCLGGYPNEAVELVDAVLPSVTSEGGAYRLRLEVVALRAMTLAFRDSACLERSALGLVELAELGKAHELEFAQVRIYEAMALFRLNRIPESLERLHSIASLLRSRPDSAALAQCSGSLASAYIALGDWVNARRYSLDALVSARRISSDLHEGVALGNLCIAERGRCRFASAEEAGIEAAAAYERAGAVIALAHVRRSLAIASLKRGRAAAAAEAVEQSIVAASGRMEGPQLWYGQLVLAQAHTQMGDVAKAQAQLSAEFYCRGEVRESRPELLRLEYLGDVELEQGHVEAALARYDEVLPHALALIPRGDVVAELRRRRAECYYLLGHPQQAHDEARDALTLCLELGDRYEEAATYRTLALSAAALSDHEAARKHFDHGFAMYDDIETPYEWGKLWMSYGDWLAGAHAGAYESLDGAREAYRAACDHFEHMGAELKLAQARERMSALEQRLRDEGVAEFAVNEKPRPRRRPSVDRELQRRVQWAHDTFALVTRHRPLIEMLEQVARVAVSDLPVLVLGESGTGKELIARGVHALSGRTGRLVEVNCSAVPATMMESEFFGAMQGSYTGSTRDRAGLFEEAHDGSIFMDEIGEMPVDLQSKLLRFLETGEVRRIGANTARQVDARLIAATNRDPVKMQAGDGFRQDLYYRLAHAVFTLPPLRSRGDDVALLVDYFIDLHNTTAHKRVQFSRAARERLVRHPWPGNVRQLRSLIERLVVQTADGHTLTPRDIPLAETTEGPRNFMQEMEGQEKTKILEALEKSLYIKADAARILRMSRTTLLGKMKRYQIPG